MNDKKTPKPQKKNYKKIDASSVTQQPLDNSNAADSLESNIDYAIDGGIIEIQAEMISDVEFTEYAVEYIDTPTIPNQQTAIADVIPDIIHTSNSLEITSSPLTEIYTFIPDSTDTVLVTDKPSLPLQSITISNKENYSNFLNKNFKIFYNGIELYDSQIAASPIEFEEDYFILFNKKYSYKGIMIKLK